MSIVILSDAASVTSLTPAGAVGIPLSDPPPETRNLAVSLEGAAENRTGVWEVDVGRFERQLANAEVMHILTGECTFTPDNGAPRDIRAGDTLFFPANTTGVWDVRVPLRKVYVVFA
jgi:uncharacterized cupin superfamily protein